MVRKIQCCLIFGLAFCIGLFSFTLTPFAQTEEFITRVIVGDDTQPPTDPTALVATPIATTQIDLTWGSSTDDFLLSGYHVWRDDVRIATTTNTSYSDTGLTASTLYTYYIIAFDSAFNLSGSSTPSVTTTLSLPSPTPTTTDNGTSGTRMRSLSEEIISLEILPQKDSVIIRYETVSYIRSVIQWGRETSYELGSLAEKAFSKFHETKIAGLTPGTKYYFSIAGENKIGRYGAMHVGDFMTLPPDDVFPPGNVTNIQAIRDGDDIVLSWANPTDPDLFKIRVVRNDQFYPGDIADGWVTYEGQGEGVRDRGGATNGLYQYYTIFSYDALGNISSGAVVRVYLGEGQPPTTNIDPTKNEILLSPDAIIYSQDGKILTVENGSVRIDGAKHLTISIPYERLPEHLKTILVVIKDSRNNARTFEFLLRVNKEKTAYISTLAPFGTSGDFPIQISVFDFKTAQIGYVHGTLISHIKPMHTESDAAGFFGWIIDLISMIGGSYVLWFIILLIMLAYTGRRLMHAEW